MPARRRLIAGLLLVMTLAGPLAATADAGVTFVVQAFMDRTA